MKIHVSRKNLEFNHLAQEVAEILPDCIDSEALGLLTCMSTCGYCSSEDFKNKVDEILRWLSNDECHISEPDGTKVVLGNCNHISYRRFVRKVRKYITYRLIDRWYYRY